MKFNIGDTVRCFREETDDLCGFDFVGEVEWANDTGEGIEYRVSNAPNLWVGRLGPILIWEEEMELVQDTYTGSVRQHEDSQDWGDT
jgi:hypothetical protein